MLQENTSFKIPLPIAERRDTFAFAVLPGFAGDSVCLHSLILQITALTY